MGKRSIKENKNIYQTSRECLSLTREKASELMQYISADRIEKIESKKLYFTIIFLKKKRLRFKIG